MIEVREDIPIVDAPSSFGTGQSGHRRVDDIP